MGCARPPARQVLWSSLITPTLSVTRCQLNFVQRRKWPCLSVLLKHRVMPEAEAMRFLHGVADMTEVADKLKQKTAYEMLRSLVGSEMCIRDR